MKALATIGIFAVFATGVFFYVSKRSHPSVPPPPVHAAMPAPNNMQTALSTNYEFMSAEFSYGDKQTFGFNYAETAAFFAPTYGALKGRNEIAAKFGGEGKRLGIKNFQRVSDGFTIDQREVADSGTYAVEGGPLPFASKGRYRTHWHFTEDGNWLIMSDSIFVPAASSAKTSGKSQ